ncbi:MAG TPA: FAD-dependent oxidoreductase, partial [Thermodesulfobacteriota bacterium]|nr:FAD-dependent oxidoreductase [Thermodesulfobacteriota bacterium]
MKTSIAVIGGGMAGLTAAYLLQEKYQVSLFEKSDRIGGNAY